MYLDSSRYILEQATVPPNQTTLVRGGITWEYAGPAIYVDEMGDQQQSRDEVRDGSGDPALGIFAHTVREDADGRLWHVRDVNWTAVDGALSRYEGLIRRDLGDDVVEADTRPSADVLDDPPPIDEVNGSLFSWDAHVVGAWRIWDNDNRVAHASPQTSIQKKVLLYMLGDATGPENHSVCSATMIDPENNGQFASTAAHCVKDEEGTWTNPRGYVCVDGNKDGGTKCAKVIARYTNGWTGATSDDYALLELDNETNLGVGYMALSSASNSTIKANTNWNSGYPQFLPTITGATTLGTATLGTPSFGSGSACDPNASSTTLEADCWMQGYQSSAIARYTTSALIGTTLDMTSCHSGGPIYYFNNNNAHFMIGIASGDFFGADFNWHNGGPKIPGDIGDWFVTTMNAWR